LGGFSEVLSDILGFFSDFIRPGSACLTVSVTLLEKQLPRSRFLQFDESFFHLVGTILKHRFVYSFYKEIRYFFGKKSCFFGKWVYIIVLRIQF